MFHVSCSSNQPEQKRLGFQWAGVTGRASRAITKVSYKDHLSTHSAHALRTCHKNDCHLFIRTVQLVCHSYFVTVLIIESVDSISRGGTDTPIKLCNTLQTPKYLKTGNFVEFFKCQSQSLQQIIYLSRPRSFIKTLVHARTRLSENSHLSIFLSF